MVTPCSTLPRALPPPCPNKYTSFLDLSLSLETNRHLKVAIIKVKYYKLETNKSEYKTKR